MAKIEMNKFGNAINVIRDEKNGRFCLINLNDIVQKEYYIFDKKYEYLLELFQADQLSRERIKKFADKKVLKEIMTDLRKKNYFKNLKLNNDFRMKMNIKHRLAHLIGALKRRIAVENDSCLTQPLNGRELFIEIMVTNACNLKCQYCYATRNLKYNFQAASDLYITKSVINAIFDKSIAYLKAKPGKGKLGISFFGGQPSLRGKARKMLFYAAEYARRLATRENLHLQLGVTDNGTEIDDELISFFKEYNIQLLLSFDTPKYVHDIHRPGLKNEKTGSLIEGNIKKLIENQIFPEIRVTVSGLNQNRLVESIDYLKKMGLHAADFMPVVQMYSKVQEYSLPVVESDKLFEETWKAYEHTKEMFSKEGYLFFMSPLLTMLRSIVNGGTTWACGMGIRYLNINTNGDIHTCGKVRVPNFYVGNIMEKNIFNNIEKIDLRKKSNSIHTPFMKPEETCASSDSCICRSSSFVSCAGCEFLRFCGGGCAAEPWTEYGCKNVGGSFLHDSMPPRGITKCYYTKKLYQRLFWEYIDADKDEKTMKFIKALIKNINEKFWSYSC